MVDLKRLMREGLYGFTGTKLWTHPKRRNVRRQLLHPPVDAAFAAKLVAHVHANMNKWLARGDLWVSGTIDDIDLTRAPAESFLVTFSEDTDSDSDSDAEYVHVVESEDEGDEDAAAGGSGEELELDEEKGEGGEEEAEGVEGKAEAEADPNAVYCLCRQSHGPSGESEAMIQCENCKEWFHDECVDFVDDDDAEWRCPPCLLPVPRSPSKKKRSGRAGLGPVTSPRKRRKPAKFADQG